MKKLLITIFIIIFIGIFGIAIYFGVRGKNNTVNNEDGSGISFREFFPFGQKADEPEPNIVDNTNTGNSNTDTGVVNNQIEKPKIRKIYEGPVAGINAIEKTKIDEVDPNTVLIFPAVRSVNRITGNVIDIFPDTEEQVIVSSRTIPKIHEALFGPEGSNVVFRYLSDDLETTESFVASFVPGASLENSLKGSFLPENLISLTVDEQTGKIFYLQNFDGTSTGSTSDGDGSNKKSIFSHPFSEWAVDFISPTKLLFTTKPSGLTPGYSYILNTSNNIFEKLTGGINGLTVLPSRNGERFLIGEGNASDMKISWYDLKTSQTKGTQINSIPEKCVWSSNNSVVYCGVPLDPQKTTYPDNWYQGQISFNDSVEKYDLTLGTKETLGFPSESVDLINPSLSKDEKYLYFINKRDGSIWVVDLSS